MRHNDNAVGQKEDKKAGKSKKDAKKGDKKEFHPPTPLEAEIENQTI